MICHQNRKTTDAYEQHLEAIQDEPVIQPRHGVLWWVRRVLCLGVVALVFGGCAASPVSTNPETGLNATEETCAESQEWMETQGACLHMTPAEKQRAKAFAHDKQIEGEAKEAEKVIKQRHAEELADSVEGR